MEEPQPDQYNKPPIQPMAKPTKTKQDAIHWLLNIITCSFWKWFLGLTNIGKGIAIMVIGALLYIFKDDPRVQKIALQLINMLLTDLQADIQNLGSALS